MPGGGGGNQFLPGELTFIPAFKEFLHIERSYKLSIKYTLQSLLVFGFAFHGFVGFSRFLFHREKSYWAKLGLVADPQRNSFCAGAVDHQRRILVILPVTDEMLST